jgi:hypothetical protein
LANDKLNRDYLPELASLLIRLPSNIDAKPLQNNFHSLLHIVPVSVETNLPAASANLLTHQLARLQAIRDTPNCGIFPQAKLLKHLRNAEYLHELERFQEAEEEISLFQGEVELENDSHADKIKKIAYSHHLKADLVAKSGRFDQAIQEVTLSTKLILLSGEKDDS